MKIAILLTLTFMAYSAELTYGSLEFLSDVYAERVKHYSSKNNDVTPHEDLSNKTLAAHYSSMGTKIANVIVAAAKAKGRMPTEEALVKVGWDLIVSAHVAVSGMEAKPIPAELRVSVMKLAGEVHRQLDDYYSLEINP